MAERTAQASVLVEIGAAFSKGFESTFTAAERKLKHVGDVIHVVQQRSRQYSGLQDAARTAGAPIAGLEQRLGSWQGKLTAAEARVASLRTTIAASGDPTGKFALRLDAAHQAADRARLKIAEVDQALGRARTQFSEATARAEEFAAANRGLAGSISRVGAAYARLEGIELAMSRNEAARTRYRTGLFEAVGVGLVLREYAKAAGERQEAWEKFGLAIRSSDRERALEESRTFARAWERSELGGETDVLKVLSVLAKGGIKADVADRIAAPILRFNAVVRGDATESARQILETYKNLGSRLPGTYEQRIARIGDVFAKAVTTFDIRDPNELFAGLSKSLGLVSAAGGNLDQAVAFAAALQARGTDPDAAGAAYNAILRRMTAASQQLGFHVARDARGNLDVVASLYNLRARLGERHGDRMQFALDDLMKFFPRQAADAVAKLMEPGALADLERAQKALGNSAGFTEQAYQKFRHSVVGDLTVIAQAFVSFGKLFGDSLLPGLGNVLKLGTAVTDLASKFLTTFPRVTAVIGTVIAALFTAKLASSALGFAWTSLKGGALALGRTLEILQVDRLTRSLGVTEKEVLALGKVMKRSAAEDLTAFANALRGVKVAGTEAAAAEVAVGDAGKAAAVGMTAATTAAKSGGLIGALGAIGSAAGIAAAAIGGLAMFGGAPFAFMRWTGDFERLGVFFKGFGKGFVDVMRPMLSDVAGLVAPIMPVLRAVGTAFASITRWIVAAFTPMRSSASEMGEFASQGERLGRAVAGIVGIAVLPFSLLGRTVQWVWDKVRGLVAEVGKLGEAINRIPFMGWAFQSMGISPGSPGTATTGKPSPRDSATVANPAPKPAAPQSRPFGLGAALASTLISIGLPAFAKGGVVDRPTLAIIGEERKKEAVVPLDVGTPARDVDVPITVDVGGIHIYARPGQDAKEIAASVRDELSGIVNRIVDRKIRDGNSQRRSALHD